MHDGSTLVPGLSMHPPTHFLHAPSSPRDQLDGHYLLYSLIPSIVFELHPVAGLTIDHGSGY